MKTIAIKLHHCDVSHMKHARNYSYSTTTSVEEEVCIQLPSIAQANRHFLHGWHLDQLSHRTHVVGSRSLLLSPDGERVLETMMQ